MRNFFRHSFSPVALMGGLVGVLAMTYIGLIAVVMSYAALTVEFTQSVRSDESQVATLESAYLGAVASISASDYVQLGYDRPQSIAYVAATSPGTALR